VSTASHNSDLEAASSDAAFNPSGLSLAEPSDFFALMKPRVMSLVVFTAWVGLVLAPGVMPLWAAIASIICIAAGAGASGALNMWYDADIGLRRVFLLSPFSSISSFIRCGSSVARRKISLLAARQGPSHR